MTDRKSRQLTALGGAVAVLLVVMFVMSRGEGPVVGTTRPSGQRGQRAGTPAGPPPVVDVRLEVLNAERGDPMEPQRNPFVFRPRVAPPAARPAEPPPPAETAPPVTAGPPPPPPIPLKFIGVLEIPRQNARVAVLSDGRGGTYHAREGETVLGQYRLLKIGTESAEMSYVDGRGRQTLRLSGQ